MPTSVELQPDIMSCLAVIIFLILVLVSPLVYWLIKCILLSLKNRSGRTESFLPPPVPRRMPHEIKGEYLNRLYEIQRRYAAKEVTSKQSYLMLSYLVRDFVKKYTNIEVTTKTLSEIKELCMPLLDDLVAQLYEPEFSLSAETDMNELFFKTKRVIEEWN